jgi:hypothetical protein
MVGFDGWLEPWWFERQVDPRSPDFVPGEPRHNLAHRSWTLLGSLGSTARGIVDSRGLVTVGAPGWSLDWWIGADDRWHLPSREVAVRQQLVDDAPVVETAMRVPGGDARHRVFGFRSGGDHLAVEITNDTAVPFALALAVRPANPLGRAAVRCIDLDDLWVLVDGRPGMLLSRRPGLVAVGSEVLGDVVHAVVGGTAAPQWPGPVECRAGRATAAFVFPLAHTATLRVTMPFEAPARGPRSVPTSIPDATRVARGWAAQAGVGARVVLPDQRLQSAFEAARRHLLLADGGEEVTCWPPRVVGWTELAAIVNALDRLGHHDASDQLLRTIPDRQALDGHLVGGNEGLAANGAALHALAEHWRLTRDQQLAESLVGAVAKAGHWIAKRRRTRRGRRPVVGPVVDLVWGLAGLRGAAAMMRAIGQPELAEDLAGFAGGLEVDLHGAIERTRERHGTEVLPTMGDGTVDGGVAENLVTSWLGVLAPDHPSVVATAEWVRSRADVDGAVFELSGRRGLSARLTVHLAALELAVGDRAGLDRLASVVALASPTWAWPEVTNPRSKEGSAGDGHHGATTAELCTLVRRLLVLEGDTELVLCPVVPDTWLGLGWEVHDLPTRFGLLGFAVRWHGERPALLWQLDPHPGVPTPTLRIPGLDPGWSALDTSGEVLLARAEPGALGGPGGPDPASSGSFG